MEEDVSPVELIAKGKGGKHTYPFNPESRNSLVRFVDGFKLIPVKWPWLAELGTFGPIRDKPGPNQLTRAVGLDKGFNVGKLVGIISLLTKVFLDPLQGIQSLDDLPTQTLRIATGEGTTSNGNDQFVALGSSQLLDKKYLLAACFHFFVLLQPLLKSIRHDIVLDTLMASRNLAVNVTVAQWSVTLSYSAQAETTYSKSRSGSLEFQPLGNILQSVKGSSP